MAGGEGTRLLPYTRVLPKPLLPVNDRPVLDIIVGQLRDAGVTEVVLATGYLSSLIEAYFGDGEAFGVKIRYARESDRLGTIGPLAGIDIDEDVLVMNGDILTRPIYGQLMAAHAAEGAIATIATRMQPVDVDFGVLQLSGDDDVQAVHGILEKPRYSFPVSTGIYAFSPRILEFIPRGTRIDFPSLIERLLAAGERIAAFEHQGYWLDVGQLHRLDEAVRTFEGNAVDYLVGGLERDPRAAPGMPAPAAEVRT